MSIFFTFLNNNIYVEGIKQIDKTDIYNANKLGVSHRIKLLKSDVDNLIFRKYDLIVSNPPYIKKFDLNKLNREVIDYEPIMALDGGLEGLSVIRKVIKKSSELIKTRGKLILEIGHDQKELVKKITLSQEEYAEKYGKNKSISACIIAQKNKSKDKTLRFFRSIRRNFFTNMSTSKNTFSKAT